MKILFMGRKKVGANALEWLVKEGYDVVGVLTDSHLVISPTSEVARKYDLPLMNYDEVLHKAKKSELSYDLGLSMLYWRILRDELLATPKYGVINFHPAPLPEYKGTGGYNMAILEGQSDWAVSAHYMDKGIDTGGIIENSPLQIDLEQETALSLEAKCQPLLLELFKKVVRQVSDQGTLPTTLNTGGKHISRNEMEAMKAIHDGDDLDKKTRAFWFPPYNGAWIEIDGEKYTLVSQKMLINMADPSSSHLFVQKKGSK